MDYDSKINRIKELTVYLNKCRDEYYNASNPSISDTKYDSLFDELTILEKETGFSYYNSPTKTVGYAVNSYLPKVKHSIPLLSLDKTKDFSEASNFTKGKDALLMFKLDGLTICLTYDNGELIEASTRGNGEEGSVITDNARTFWNIPNTIGYLGRIKITGEGIIHRSDFEEINSRLPDDEKYKTPRNLVSGSVQQLDSKICASRKVYFYAFNVIEGLDGIDKNNLDKKLDFVQTLGFDVCPYVILKGNTDSTEFNDLVNQMVNDAEIASIPIDGLVVMYRDTAYGKSLGRTGHHYKNGIALKFKEEEEETTITDIQWQVGRTGKITPVAIFDPVILDGTTVTAASLHNIGIIEKLGIRKNATVTVVKKNEIIPQIIKSVGGDEKFEYPRKCPVCGSLVFSKSEDGIITLSCENEDCVAKNVRNLTYFVSKDCMNIDGLSEKILQKFVDAGLIHSYADIYDLVDKKEEIVSFEGMGEKSFDLLVKAIENSKNVKLENFIAALSISGIALSKAKAISKRFNGEWSNFKAAVDDDFDFTTIDGFGKEINKNIYHFFDTKFNVDSEYARLVDMMNFIEPEENGENIFDGKTFVITGTLEKYSNRKELQELIESMGGKVAGSVSKNTSYLINNDINSSSSKNKNAKKLNVPIITENDFLQLLKNK